LVPDGHLITDNFSKIFRRDRNMFGWGALVDASDKMTKNGIRV